MWPADRAQRVLAGGGPEILGQRAACGGWVALAGHLDDVALAQRASVHAAAPDQQVGGHRAQPTIGDDATSDRDVGTRPEAPAAEGQGGAGFEGKARPHRRLVPPDPRLAVW